MWYNLSSLNIYQAAICGVFDNTVVDYSIFLGEFEQAWATVEGLLAGKMFNPLCPCVSLLLRYMQDVLSRFM